MNKNAYQEKDGRSKVMSLLENTAGVDNVHLGYKAGLEFKRDVYFETRGRSYIIRWFINMMTLISEGEMETMFYNIHNLNTWPQKGVKASLALEGEDGKTICNIPTEFYEGQEYNRFP